MNKADLIQKCSRAMLEAGPDVKVSLEVPSDPGRVSADGLTMELPLGNLRAVIKSHSVVGDKPMTRVHVKAADLLKVLQ